MNLPLFPSHPECAACDLHEYALNVGIETICLPDSLPPGPGVPALLIVGQNPGLAEDERGIPFIERSGRMVREGIIPGAGLDKLATIYLTNAVRCHSLENAPPSDKQARLCAPHTCKDVDAIAAAHPNAKHVMFLLGAVAVKNIHKHVLETSKVGLKDSFKAQGKTYNTRGKWTVFSTYHPAAALRAPNLESSIHDHTGLLLAHLTNTSVQASKPNIVPVAPPTKGEST